MKRKKFFQTLYKYNIDNNSYLIEVSLDDYTDVYDDWDPSPFKKRDIENEFNDFIINSSLDIPLKYNISLVLYLPSTKKDKKKEAALISAYKNYYNYAVERLSRKKNNVNKKTTLYLFLSIILLSIGDLFSSEHTNVILSVIDEGIFIGGWVFLWEFFTNTFISKKELTDELAHYKRLYEADVNFEYI